MGQKINPLGFRLGTTQSHDSIWFAQPTNYSENLKEDKKIRDCIKTYIQKTIKISSGVEGIGRIKIQKRIDLIQVIIYMGFPKLLIDGKPRRIEELQINVQKKMNYVNRKLNIAITRIANAYRDPNILAEFIAGQLKNRVSFRKAMKKAIELTEQAGRKRVSEKIGGRIEVKKNDKFYKIELKKSSINHLISIELLCLVCDSLVFLQWLNFNKNFWYEF